jgi:hypothetical protein
MKSILVGAASIRFLPKERQTATAIVIPEETIVKTSHKKSLCRRQTSESQVSDTAHFSSACHCSRGQVERLLRQFN